MPEVFAPFSIERTIRNLTFYRMEGRNFVRTKSSLTRKKVLHSPRFERTRRYAGLMAKASKIGSLVYKALPEYWRQFWMYRSFTGEALTLLKNGKQEKDIQEVLYERYVKEIAEKAEPAVSIGTAPKRVYRKLNTAYWKGKTIKSKRLQTRKQLTFHYARMLASASKIASKLYRQLSFNKRRRGDYYQFVAYAMQLLKDEWQEKEIMEVLGVPSPPVSAPMQPSPVKKFLGKLSYQGRYFYFVAPAYKKTILHSFPDLSTRCWQTAVELT